MPICLLTSPLLSREWTARVARRVRGHAYSNPNLSPRVHVVEGRARQDHALATIMLDAFETSFHDRRIRRVAIALLARVETNGMEIEQRHATALHFVRCRVRYNDMSGSIHNFPFLLGEGSS